RRGARLPARPVARRRRRARSGRAHRPVRRRRRLPRAPALNQPEPVGPAAQCAGGHTRRDRGAPRATLLTVARSVLFEKEPVPGLWGLAGLTAPGSDEGVALVVDAVVLGAKGDGKTQLITHAIRTLDARPAAGLGTEEQLQNEKILGLVLNAKRPMPEANPDK